MKTIKGLIHFLEAHIIECPQWECARCDEAREYVEFLKEIDPMAIHNIMPEGPISDDSEPALYPECEQYSLVNIRKSLESKPE